jgi:hypothetical protein
VLQKPVFIQLIHGGVRGVTDWNWISSEKELMQEFANAMTRLGLARFRV